MRKTLVIALITLTCGIANATNLGDARMVIRYRIHDTTGPVNSPRWTDTAINARINLKHRQVCSFTNCLYTNALIDAVTGQAEYSLPTDLKTIDRVSFQVINSTGSYKGLVATTLNGLDRDFVGGWERDTGYPLRFYRRGFKIGLYPKPSGTYAYSSGLKIDYFQKPYDISFDTDVFYNNDTTLTGLYEEVVITGVVADLKRESGESYQADFQDYIQWLNLMKDMIKLDTVRQDTIRVNYNDASNPTGGGGYPR